MKYLAGTVFAGVALLFCYLMATATDEIALGFGVGVLISAMLVCSAAWLGYTLRK
jgi:hypothetical protein